MQLSPWIMAGRPRTLTLSVTPVIVGAALAWAVERELHWGAIVAALVASVFIQLGTNLHNDAADSERGGDGPDRVGPPRVTQARRNDLFCSCGTYGPLSRCGRRLANSSAGHFFDFVRLGLHGWADADCV